MVIKQAIDCQYIFFRNKKLQIVLITPLAVKIKKNISKKFITKLHNYPFEVWKQVKMNCTFILHFFNLLDKVSVKFFIIITVSDF